jgi:hypothetical protein
MNSDDFLEGPAKSIDTADEDFISGGIQFNESKKTLKDIIIPMKPKDLFDEHFKFVIGNSNIKMNIFILGYKCDHGIRACGGRSGAELGPDSFRKLLYLNSNHDLCQKFKEKGIVIYDLGDIGKYQLSKFT